jgi:hypothetical protein
MYRILVMSRTIAGGPASWSGLGGRITVSIVICMAEAVHESADDAREGYLAWMRGARREG